MDTGGGVDSVFDTAQAAHQLLDEAKPLVQRVRDLASQAIIKWGVFKGLKQREVLLKRAGNKEPKSHFDLATTQASARQSAKALPASL
jgi:hypothetical protein